MGEIKQLWVMLTRNSRHTLFLFLLVFSCGVLGVVGSYLQAVVSSYQENVIRDFGYQLALYRTDGADIPDDVLEELQSLPHVSGINNSADCLVQPVDFVNAVAQDTESVFTSVDAVEVRLLGDWDTWLNPTYQSCTALLSGTVPDSQHSGVLIDTVLARKNNLTVGDTMTVALDGREETLSVLGIYELTQTIVEETDTGDYTESVSTPYSYLFCDLASYARLQGEDWSWDSVTICADSASALAKAEAEVTALGLPEDTYTLKNVTEGELHNRTHAQTAIERTANLVSVLSVVLAGTVLFLVILLWMRSNYRDIAVLISLGQSRGTIIRQYLTMVTAIVIPALLLSIPCCMAIAGELGSRFSQTVFTVTGVLTADGNLGESDGRILDALNAGLSVSDCLCSGLIYLLTAWAAGLLASAEILRCNPRVLFEAR